MSNLRRNSIFITVILLFAAFAVAQQPEQPGPIQDNSFLIEEAYNQEPGVIQHINFFSRTFDTKDWVYTFTEEWPVTGQKHQFSFTLSGMNVSGYPGAGAGIGDTAINYRYQLVGSGETRLAVAPRISALLPTGDSRLGRGFGGAGLQVNLPASIVLHPKLVTHLNAGATFVPNSRNDAGQTASVNGYNLGQSFIWLAHPNFNVMFEAVLNANESVVAPGKTQRNRDLLLSPGVRWAHNFKNGLQIVPGVAFPFGAGPSAGENGVIFYLSFEHPLSIFGKTK